ncbi:MAG: hypothetical protein SFZ24_05815 [Planctomycetota bacterium]|nr:hypothetical protein [Planctomycetota bacterium]
MPLLFRSALTLRVPLLLIVGPAALLASNQPGGGVWLTAIVWTSLVMLAALRADARTVAAGHDPRLGVASSRARTPDRLYAPALFILIDLAVLAVIALAFFQPLLALLSVAAGVAIALWPVSSRQGPRSLASQRLAELRWPLGMLIIPALCIWLQTALRYSETATAPAHAASLAAVFLASLILGAAVLASQIRDELKDREHAARSTPALLGRDASMLWLLVWMIGAVALAALGVGQDWWAWPVAAITSSAAMISTLALAWRLDRRAVAAWWFAGAATMCAAGLTAPTASRPLPAANPAAPQDGSSAAPPVSGAAQQTLIEQAAREARTTR